MGEGACCPVDIIVDSNRVSVESSVTVGKTFSRRCVFMTRAVSSEKVRMELVHGDLVVVAMQLKVAVCIVIVLISHSSSILYD